MNKIMFEMQAWALNYNFFASIDDGIVEYEIEENTPESGSVDKKGKLDKERSKLFTDFLELANINNIDELVEELRNRDDFITYTDSPTFSISSFKYSNAFWNEYEEVDNMYFIYLAICLCDDGMFDELIGNKQEGLSTCIKEYVDKLGFVMPDLDD